MCKPEKEARFKSKKQRESIKKHEVFKSSSDIQRDPHKAALSGVQPKSGKLQNKDPI